jgi:uncharacterized protein YdgA (DUF945 family)
MKKLRMAVIGVVALLVLAALGGPAVTGGIAARRIEAGVAAINRQGQFDASYTRTASGWFGQQGTLTITPRAAALDQLLPAGRPITLHMDVAYGPFPFAAWGQGFTPWPVGAVINLRSPALDRLLAKAHSGYTLRGTVGLAGGNDVLARLRAGSYRTADGGSIEWQPLHLRAENLIVRDGMSAGDLGLRWRGLTFSKNGPGTSMQARVGAVELHGSSRFEDGVPVGRYRFTVDSIETTPVPTAADQGFALRTLRVVGGAAIGAPGFVDSSAHFEIASLRAGAGRFAPMVLDLDLTHLDIPAYVALTRALQKAQRDAPPGTPPLVAARLSMAALQPPLMMLLARQPMLQLKQLRIGMPQGAVQGSGEISLAPGSVPTPQTLLPALRAHFTLSAPQTLALYLAAERAAKAGAPPAQQGAMAQQMLQQFVQQGLLRRQAGDYVLDLSVDKGAVQLNGRTIRQL